MNTTLFIILSIVLIVVGFVLALLIIPVLGLDKSSSRQTASNDDSPNPTKTNPPILSDVRSLRVWRNPQKGTLTVEIDGQVYNAVTELSQEQRQFLGTTTTELVAWLSQAVYVPGLPRADEPPVRPPSPFEKIPVQPDVKPADRSVVNAFLRTIQPGNPKKNQPPKSLAAQVDEILQEKLADSGISHHTIHLMDTPNYGLAVLVDREQYESIDSVPDEAIQKLIREAVQEWQKRGSLGKM